MCTAYELSKRGGTFPARVSAVAVEELMSISRTHLIRPTIPAPVVKADGSLATMNWGFRRALAAKTKGQPPTMRTVVNSREDKLDGRMWKEAFGLRRCLIPASSFYEWVEIEGRKVPLRFERPGEEWIWIAGIWEEGEQGECFSMITTEPNEVLAPVHDRMPAVLSDEQIDPFLEDELSSFGPSAVLLQYREADNFLKSKKGGDPPTAQADLF
ncbi:MAG: hypothetical protein RLZZ505_2831 [Verrucomicrobiota bacterium]|jgi:putative SOS response-associated peptidase YedK